MPLPSPTRSIREQQDEQRKVGSSHATEQTTANALEATDASHMSHKPALLVVKEQSPSRLPVPGTSDNAIVGNTRRRSLLPQRASGSRQTFLARETVIDGLGEKHKSSNARSGFGQNYGGQPADTELVKRSHYAEGPENRDRAAQAPLMATTKITDQFVMTKSSRPPSMAPPSLIRRSQSLRKPMNYEGAPKAASRGHARNASAIVTSNNDTASKSHRRQASNVAAAACPPSRPNLGSTQGGRSDSAASNCSGITRISERSIGREPSEKAQVSCTNGLKRISSAITNQARKANEPAWSQAQSQSQRSSLASSTVKPISNDAKDPIRPAFSTLQQHFTPRKTLKAPTASFLAPSPTKFANSNILPSETVRLQTELLQLHLLHRFSAEVHQEWERSAESKLRQQYEIVTARHHASRLLESKAQHRTDLLAFKDWKYSGQSLELAERVQVLSRTIQELYLISDTGGKYHRIVTSFERWIVCNERIWRIREHNDPGKSQDMEFVEDIGGGWMAEVVALERRLTSSSHDLEYLGQPRKGSTLALIVAICTTMVTQMFEELRVMRDIESEVVEREKRWVVEMIDRMDLQSGNEPEAAKLESRKALWQSG
ncbi:MAG: hypothetical protein M1830_005464 [Pleopsidium flavum]|nr:MAG: hypothetical protein M1830_005464 [Pleopsidium flavum]